MTLGCRLGRSWHAEPLFGLQVQDEASRSFGLKNAGRYPITFDCSVAKARLKGLLALEPSSGQIAPGASQSITATFNGRRTLRRELRLVKDEALQIVVTEPATGQPESTVGVPVSVEAVFSKYSLRPHHGLDFGPQVYDTSSSPRKVELSNTGRFPFSFRLFDLSNPEGEGRPSSKDASRKDAKKGGKTAPAVPGVQIGQFAVSPASGLVEPGSSATIEVRLSRRRDETILLHDVHPPFWSCGSCARKALACRSSSMRVGSRRCTRCSAST